MKLLHDPNGARLKYYFNVSEPVGRGCKNRPDDVYLVQYMLHKLFTRSEVANQMPLRGDGILRA